MGNTTTEKWDTTNQNIYIIFTWKVFNISNQTEIIFTYDQILLHEVISIGSHLTIALFAALHTSSASASAFKSLILLEEAATSD